MNTSQDAPYLECAYKLQEYAGQPRRKHSEGKSTWPGRKQVYRSYDAAGKISGDVMALETETQNGKPLMIPFMRGGKRVKPASSLNELRAHAVKEMATLPEGFQKLEPVPPFQVKIGAGLQQLANDMDQKLAASKA